MYFTHLKINTYEIVMHIEFFLCIKTFFGKSVGDSNLVETTTITKQVEYEIVKVCSLAN